MKAATLVDSTEAMPVNENLPGRPDEPVVAANRLPSQTFSKRSVQGVIPAEISSMEVRNSLLQSPSSRRRNGDETGQRLAEPDRDGETFAERAAPTDTTHMTKAQSPPSSFAERTKRGSLSRSQENAGFIAEQAFTSGIAHTHQSPLGWFLHHVFGISPPSALGQKGSRLIHPYSSFSKARAALSGLLLIYVAFVIQVRFPQLYKSVCLSMLSRFFICVSV